MKVLGAAVLWILFTNVGVVVAGDGSTAPIQGAALLKTDIMGVFAHPDDETGMAATIAYYSFGRQATVVNVYCTRGEGGGNMVGTQWGAALGILRETELRDCLATIGVRSCYFLDRLDWAYTESVAATLQAWNKEETLERLVRVIRTLRPEVIVTMNPAPTAGQHGHHQAAGVLATEAFSAAADPHRFPLQLSKEGLSIWQPRKLFFGGGGSNQVVAAITVNQTLPSGKSPAQLASQALVHHRSQGFGNFGNSPFMQRPQQFTLVKAFVPVEGTQTDLLALLPASDSSLKEIHFAKQPPKQPLGLRFISRPAFENYRRWVAEQDIEHVAAQFRADLPLVAGEPNRVYLQLTNANPSALEGELTVTVPEGWQVTPASRRVKSSGETSIDFALQITPPPGRPADSELTAVCKFDQGPIMETTAKAHLVPRARVARIANAPTLDATDRGWEKITSLAIAPTDLVQGKSAGDADSSALFRLAHDGKTLFVDVQVKDDVVVTNIAPNDIRGHWRSDSVEICIDPAAGAENTFGSYKLGIFPFDTTGVVRAARDADGNQGPVEETAPRTRLVSRRTVDGYRIQVAIPFDEIGLAPDQKRLGFNIIIYDGDKADAALGENINKSRIAWSPRPGVQGRPEDWGRIDLE